MEVLIALVAIMVVLVVIGVVLLGTSVVVEPGTIARCSNAGRPPTEP